MLTQRKEILSSLRISHGRWRYLRGTLSRRLGEGPQTMTSAWYLCQGRILRIIKPTHRDQSMDQWQNNTCQRGALSRTCGYWSLTQTIMLPQPMEFTTLHATTSVFKGRPLFPCLCLPYCPIFNPFIPGPIIPTAESISKIIGFGQQQGMNDLVTSPSTGRFILASLRTFITFNL